MVILTPHLLFVNMLLTIYRFALLMTRYCVREVNEDVIVWLNGIQKFWSRTHSYIAETCQHAIYIYSSANFYLARYFP